MPNNGWMYGSRLRSLFCPLASVTWLDHASLEQRSKT